ncbi:uncharacterized protein EI97DRAFT_369427, partial [Westerdykella ornata]
LEVEVIEACKSKLGVDHPNTLTSINNLAFIFKDQDKMYKAVSLMEDCCKRQTAVLGPQHPHSISSHEALATWQLESIELGRAE